MANNSDTPILHVVVVGFHHKKGSQVEYSYPALVEGQPVDSNELPPIWKHLPSLALPDGAHNHDKDTVYFHLQSKKDEHSTVFGVSCYRQIDAKDVKNKGSEVTRNTIQKSVCVLSTLPLFGLIEAKLEMITYAWFKEKDFTQMSILEETYRQLCASCNDGLLEGSQVFLGLSCRELVVKLRHKIVMLFKLILLERKILVYGTPAKPVCTTVLSLLSLFPDLLEYGLKESAAYSQHRAVSLTMNNVRIGSGDEEFLEIHYTKDTKENSCDSTGNDKCLSKSHTAPDVNKQDVNKTTSHSCDTINTQNVKSHTKPETQKLSAQLKTDQSEQRKSSHNIIALTPSPVCEKSECELTEKSADSCEDKSQVAKKHSDTLENDLSQKQYPVTDVESTVEEKQHSKDNVATEATENSTKMEVHTSQPQSSYANKSEHSVMSQAISKDTITSEGTASDFGTASNMEELLENEECFSWREDKLMLTIGSESNEHNTSGRIEGKLSFDVEDSTLASEKRDSAANMTRMDSTASRTSQGSLTSMASDIGEASVKAFSDLKTRINSMWDGTPDDGTPEDGTAEDGTAEDGTPEEPLPQVHHLHTHQTHTETENGLKVAAEASLCRPPSPTTLTMDECGFPLPIFTKSLLCHPYLSLQYFDLLQDINVRGFLIGASNMLFRQKKHLIDVIIELPDLNVEIHDEALRRQLALSTADLRFADYLVKSVCDDKVVTDKVFCEETGIQEWEGGEEWLRGQFKLYLASLLVTINSNNEKLIEDFNPVFVRAYKTTNSYKQWKSVERRGLKEAPPGHPFQGQLSIQDIRMRFAQYERGKKLMDAAGQTGKVAVQTGKAIGGALTTAKSAVSSTVTGWFSTIKKWSASDSPVDEQ